MLSRSFSSRKASTGSPVFPRKRPRGLQRSQTMQETKSPGAKVIQKAHSIRDKIFRRPSASSQHGGKYIQPPKSPKTKKVTRGSSFSEGTSAVEQKKKDQEVDRLKQESKKVFQALKYTQDVVDKNILQQLPGSVTIVLETVMDITARLLGSYLDQESTVLISTFNRVYESLANLIYWSDQIMLFHAADEPVDKEKATEIMNAVKDAVNELMKLSIDKLERQGSGNYKNRANGRTVNSTPADKDRPSLPDIPLTPREKEILQQTQLPHFSFDTKDTGAQLNNNNQVDGNEATTPSPPPKPPLPKDYMTVLGKSEDGSSPEESETPPPPLPEKKSSMNLDSPTSPSSFKDEVFSMFTGEQRSFFGDSVVSSSPVSSTPLSVSPCSSVGSGINKSTDDLLSDRDNRTPTRTIERPIERKLSDYDNEPANAPYVTMPGVYERQLSDYDNNVCDNSKSSLGDINELTQQIQGLTSNIDNGNVEAAAPPLPVKKTSLGFVSSDYDNLNADPQDILSRMRSDVETSMAQKLGKFGAGCPSNVFFQSDFHPSAEGGSLLQGSKMMNSMQKSNFSSDISNMGSGLAPGAMQLSNLRSGLQTSLSSTSSRNYSVQQSSSRSQKVVSSQTFHSSQSSGQQSFQSSTQSYSQSSRSFTQSSFTSTNSSSTLGPNGNLVGGKESVRHETQAFGQSSSTTTLPTGENISTSKSLAHDAKTYAEKEVDCSGDSPPRMRAKFAHKSDTLGVNRVITADGTHQEVLRSGERFAVVSDGDHENAVTDGLDGDVPPLPPKKKAIEEYMKMFAGYSQPNFFDTEFTRHSMLSSRFYQEQWHQHQIEFFSPFQRSNTISIAQLQSGRQSHPPSLTGDGNNVHNYLLLPALPPKRNRSFSSLTTSLSDQNLALFPPCHDQLKSQTESMSGPKSPPILPITAGRDDRPREIPMKISSLPETMVSEKPDVEQKRLSAPTSGGGTEAKATPAESTEVVEDGTEMDNLIHAIDVSQYIIKNKADTTHDIRGGPVDALIVHATSVGKNDFLEIDICENSDFMYQEAFLTTYRTIIPPSELIKKLISRYNVFCRCSDDKRKRLSRNTFSLLIRIVDELSNDVTIDIIIGLAELNFELLRGGELVLGKCLRKKVIEKYLAKRALDKANQQVILLPSLQISTKQMTLLDFKSQEVAEQMTLLDEELFQTIEIPEMLLWSKEQKEELSPNLTKFTEHFNRMSYWVRSRILEKNDPKERVKYLIKFIKIMKELRKLKNFNSYLALLSAVDSAQIIRLEWPKQIMDTLLEMAELINSSSSFKAYRRVLAETVPPCIPYIGLILQDLTFIHVGNKDHLPDGNINFTKRWQQFNILEALRRFKKEHYTHLEKNKTVLQFFNNFEDYRTEEVLWQISESIKPRGGKSKS